MGESQFLSNFSEGGVAPTELPATMQTAQRSGHRYFQSPPTGQGHPPSLISTHKASIIVTTLSTVNALATEGKRTCELTYPSPT